MGGAGRVEHLQDASGAFGLRFDPTTHRRVIRRLRVGLGQEDAEQVLDLPQARAHREGGRGQFPLLGLIEPDPMFGVASQFGELLPEPLILPAQLGQGRLLGGWGRESLLDFLGMFVDRLATALGLACLLGHDAMRTGEDGGGVADPRSDR